MRTIYAWWVIENKNSELKLIAISILNLNNCMHININFMRTAQQRAYLLENLNVFH